jgi:Uma2 family endonuclease
MTQLHAKLTLAEFFAIPEEDVTYELIDGEAKPKMSPKRFHSRLTLAISLRLAQWAENRGEVGVEWAVKLTRRGKDWVPVPDLLYISYDRLDRYLVEDTPCPIPPDLAIEIISPDQTFGDISAKANDYLSAGVLRVWVVDARSKTITVFYPDMPSQTKSDNESLADVLFPELALAPAEIFQAAGII